MTARSLSMDDARAIRGLHRGGLSMGDLARRYAVRHCVIHQIVNGVTYKEVEAARVPIGPITAEIIAEAYRTTPNIYVVAEALGIRWERVHQTVFDLRRAGTDLPRPMKRRAA